MPSLRKANVCHYLLLGVMLCACSTAAMARDARMHGPNGGGSGCAADSAPATTSVPAATSAKPVAQTPATARGSDKVKPVVGVRGGGSDDNGSIHSSRWHSFLPGMFR